jgi:hypothetical protein
MEGDIPSATFTHEAIFRHWERLRGWIAAQLAELALFDDLASAARRWEREGRPNDLLLVSRQLAHARDLQAREVVSFSGLLSEFVARSQKRQRARRLLAAAMSAMLLTVIAWFIKQEREQQRLARERALDEDAAAVMEPPINVPCNYFLADSHPIGPPSALPESGPQGSAVVKTGRESYRREEVVKTAYGEFLYARSRRRCGLVQDASLLLRAGGVATSNESVVAFGSQVSNSYVRAIMGEARRVEPRLDVELADYRGRLRWNIHLPPGAPETISVQNKIVWKGALSKIAGLGSDENKFPDYLLVTVLPTGFNEQGRIIMFAGLHGPATSATKMLLSPERWTALREVSKQMRGERAFQLLFGVEVQESSDRRREPSDIKFIAGHRIYLERRASSAPPSEIQAWQSAMINLLETRGFPPLSEKDRGRLYGCKDLDQLRTAHASAVEAISVDALLEGLARTCSPLLASP